MAHGTTRIGISRALWRRGATQLAGYLAAIALATIATTAQAGEGATCAAPLPAATQVAGAAAAGAGLPDNILCRSAEFWGLRAGSENEHANLVQSVIDSAGGLEVCGETITRTSRTEEPYVEGFGLSSALEGLCVRVQDERRRQLYRQLLATSLNCALSGAAASEDCDDVIAPTVDVEFSDCNALCEGSAGAEQGPSLDKCIQHLRCFNIGGTIVEGDECALGRCASQQDLFCGADFDRCPDIRGRHQSCRRFPGNCFKKKLCQESLGICPSNTLRSSRDACKEAGRNDCTIDSCPE